MHHWLAVVPAWADVGARRRLGAAEARRSGPRSHGAVGDDDVGDARRRRPRPRASARRSSRRRRRGSGSSTDLLETDRADELGLLDRVDRVADEAVDIGGARARRRRRAATIDSLASCSSLRPARRENSVCPMPAIAATPPNAGALIASRCADGDGAEHRHVAITVRRLELDVRGIPMRISSGSTPTRFVTMRTPSSRSTSAASTGYSNAGCCGWCSTA